MEITGKDRGDAWLGEIGFSRVDAEAFQSNLKESMAYEIPKDSGRKTALARLLASLVNGDSKSLFWITGYGIWPSSENRELFRGYRQSLGELRSLGEAPCHFFEKPDLAQIECLILMALYFVWDAIIIEGSGNQVFKLSHDEIMTIETKDPQHLSFLKTKLEKFKLKPVQEKE